MKIRFTIIVQLFFIPVFCYSQVTDNTGFAESIIQERIGFNDSLLQTAIDKFQKESKKAIVGQVISFYYEYIDSVRITLSTTDNSSYYYADNTGFFSITDPLINPLNPLTISVEHRDYMPYDTTIHIIGMEIPVVKAKLKPKYKMLLRGRVYIRKSYLSNANVNIKFGEQQYNLRTLGCYYDEENFWNCLYDGMFRTELFMENPGDTIKLHISKKGFKPLTYATKASDYQGEILKFSMKYADTLTNLGLNSLGIRITYPFMQDWGWFIEANCYRTLSIGNFSRLAVGAEAIMVTKPQSFTIDSTLTGQDPSEIDTTYTDGFIGPSAMLWILKPERRAFSAYIGATLAYSLRRNELGIQPFLGTRYFLDLNKALTLEARYIPYKIEPIEYNFNPTGNAIIKSYGLKEIHRFLINIGIHIYF